MFPYFGRKARHAKLYPAPKYPVVIEPFAGSMAYTLHHCPPLGIGYEADERVVALWERLSKLTEVPEPPERGSKTDDLLVKLCSYSEHALTSGTMTVTSRMLRDWEAVHSAALRAGAYVAEHVYYHHGSYEQTPDIEATWFIDPPYQAANRRGYAHGATSIDFHALAEWVRSRRGQVIVCEQFGASWLPFRPLYEAASHRGARSAEVVWLSAPHGAEGWPSG